MEDFNVDGILEGIDKVGKYLSDKLEVPVEKAYDILMKQVYFELSWAVVLGLVGLLIIIISCLSFEKVKQITLNHLIDKYDQKTLHGDDWFGILLIIGIPNAIGWTIFLINVYKVLQITINPEWYMIQMIMEKIQ